MKRERERGEEWRGRKGEGEREGGEIEGEVSNVNRVNINCSYNKDKQLLLFVYAPKQLCS